MSKVTLLAFNDFLKAEGSDLFSSLDLPDGIDKDVVINNILMKGGEFEVLYSNPYFLRDSILTWSKKWYWTFDRWIKVINQEYNPLENYDRMEDWIDTEKVDTQNHIDDSTNGTTENQVSAFDTADYSNSSKSITGTIGANDSTGSVDGTSTRKGRAHGNIGTVSSQNMLSQEISVARWNLYNEIADIFLMEYVLPIY